MQDVFQLYLSLFMSLCMRLYNHFNTIVVSLHRVGTATHSFEWAAVPTEDAGKRSYLQGKLHIHIWFPALEKALQCPVVWEF